MSGLVNESVNELTQVHSRYSYWWFLTIDLHDPLFFFHWRNLARLPAQENKTSFYEVLTSYAECAPRLKDYEPRLCDEMDWPKGSDKGAFKRAEVAI